MAARACKKGVQRTNEGSLARWTIAPGTTAVQAYSVHDLHPVISDELVRRGAMRSGLTWHFARPPVIDLEYEMDCRRVTREMVV